VNFFFKHWVVLLFAFCVAFAYTHFFLNRAYVTLQISTPVKTDFKIYWAEEGKKFSESKMARITISPRTEHYTFFLTDLRKVKKLRIDPAAKESVVYLKDIALSQHGLPTVHIFGPEGFGKLRPLGEDVYSTGYLPEGWQITSSGDDPGFEYQIDLPNRSLNWFGEIIRIFFLISPLFLLAKPVASIWKDYKYTTYQGIFALALILAMATVTKVNHHPDERVHYAATRYYQNHWLPPVVDSQEIIDSYSDFGISRLNTWEVSYFFAGKFGKLFELLHLNEVITLRLFNVTLFSILVFLALGRVEFRLYFVPLLLSPQIWYIFSYMNSDAFSLFVVLLAGWQLVNKESVFNRYLTNKRVSLLKLFGISLLLTLLIFVKKNYYFFTLFLLIFFSWRCFYYPFSDFRAMIKRLSVIVCLAVILAGVRVGADIYVNGFDKSDKIKIMQELTAKPLFKPSTPLEKKFGSLLLRDKGISYLDFIQVFRWGEKTFRSGFGAYGYMTAVASDSYYDVARWLGVACLLFMGFSIAFCSDRPAQVLFTCAVLCSLALIGKASHYAWTVDFQGQGRYFFPIVAIFGMVLIQTKHIYNQLILSTLCTIMFLMSVFSFVFIGLLSLAKYGWA
jgi:hypothetical protein